MDINAALSDKDFELIITALTMADLCKDAVKESVHAQAYFDLAERLARLHIERSN